MLKIFGYLKKYPNQEICINLAIPDLCDFEPEVFDWTEQYPDAKEEIPPNMPEPLGALVWTGCYVNSDHAHDVATRRLVTGFIPIVNSMPVTWVSNWQETIEGSTYGTEFVALQMAVEYRVRLCYRLRILGVKVKGPSYMFTDNMLIIKSSTMPSAALKKKHLSICYHYV